MNDLEYYKFITQKELTGSRYAHCLRVAEIAKKISLIAGYKKPEKAYLAGILHDITKQKNVSFHKSLFEKYNFWQFVEFPEPAYHAYSATYYLVDRYNFKDEEVLSAIKNHTLGYKNMQLLDKILYVSDYLGSDYAEKQLDYKLWVELTEKNLDYGVYLKSKSIINELLEKKLEIHKNTIDVYNDAIVSLKRSEKHE